ncbi:MAG: 2-dehydropantoate 2-reductase [Ruthenibacterium sp.]
MKIAVLGAGAMGGLFSAYLSQKNDVTVIDVNQSLVEKIKADGLLLHETDGSTQVYHPDATTNAAGRQPVDLVILFVKSMFSDAALSANRDIIGKDTYLLTLQNGSGHEAVLSKFTDSAHIIIGTTQHNAAVLALADIRHGGAGDTVIGALSGDSSYLQPIADLFTACNLPCVCCDGVQKMIWNKMFTNVTVSILTGVLQMPMGYILTNPNAWAVCCQLLREAVDVAAGMGMAFDYDAKEAEMKALCTRSAAGLTSIYADLRDGRRTEVDTISGSIVRASAQCGVPAPCHTMLVNLVHALEARTAQK